MPRTRHVTPRPDISVAMASLFLMGIAACSSASSGRTLTEPNGERIAVPVACQVPEEGQRPYTVTFRVHNGGSSSVFLHTGCVPPFQVTSCASEYTDLLADPNPCPCVCGSVCPQCGACYPDGGELLDVGASKEWQWTATVYVDSGETSSGAPCTRRSDLPAGRYRVNVPLFSTAEDALVQTPVLRVAAADFELPAASEVVVVEAD